MHARRTDRTRRQSRAQEQGSRATISRTSLRQLKARHHDDHLCLRCGHHLVCGMARGLDPNLLVTITNCLGFEPAERDTRICELMPIEAMATS